MLRLGMESSRGFPRVASGLGSAQRLVLLLSPADSVAGLLPTCAAAAQITAPDRERRAGVRGGHHRRAARGDQSCHRPDRLLRGLDRLRHRHHGRPLLQHEPHPAAHPLLPARRASSRSRARCGTRVYAAYYDDGIGDFFQVTRQEDIAADQARDARAGDPAGRINDGRDAGARHGRSDRGLRARSAHEATSTQRTWASSGRVR